MDFLFLGNALWIDFLNTELHDGTRGYDLLPDVGELLRWGTESGALTAAAGRLAADQPAAAARRSFARAIELRAGLRAAALRMVKGGSPPRAAIQKANQVLLEHPRYTRISGRGAEWRSDAHDANPGVGLVAARVAEDFAQFLARESPASVRQCAQPPCKLLFHDTSRTQARRWCSMKLCGNRTKVARHRARNH